MFNKLKDFFTNKEARKKDNRYIFASMLIGAIFSLLASLVLSIEAVHLAANPGAVLACDLNAALSCSTVNSHWSAHLLGFPNSFLGMIAEPVVITVAVAGLAGVKFPRLFMFVAQICYSIGFLFALWLFYMSFFVIQALCPWCLLVTLTTTMVLFAITRYNIRENNLYLSKNITNKLRAFIDKDYDKLTMFTLITVMIAMIVVKYGNSLFG